MTKKITDLGGRMSAAMKRGDKVSIGRKLPVESALSVSPAMNEAMKAAYHVLSELAKFYWFQNPSNVEKFHATHNIKRDLRQFIAW